MLTGVCQGIQAGHNFCRYTNAHMPHNHNELFVVIIRANVGFSLCVACPAPTRELFPLNCNGNSEAKKELFSAEETQMRN